jgi:hypothetical protein
MTPETKELFTRFLSLIEGLQESIKLLNEKTILMEQQILIFTNNAEKKIREMEDANLDEIGRHYKEEGEEK